MAVECTYCDERINTKHGIYVKCTTCQDIKLCLECFSSGAQIAEHESDHPYELIDCGSFSIIDESWKACEELALLEGIEIYGLGSWTDIANAVGTRTAEECSRRYLRIYVDNFFGCSSWNAIDRNLYTVHDHTSTPERPLSPSLSLPERNKIVDISREQQIKLGYMPKRDDFEREYDNDAELLVSKLAVNANDDTDLDQELKLSHINMYTDKLRERFRRKRIVLELNLVKLFFHMHPEENTTTNSEQTPMRLPETLSTPVKDPIANNEDFNAMEKKLRIFCQFNTAEEHNKLIRNLKREQELKVKIRELMKKRKNGLKSNETSSSTTTTTKTPEPSWRLLSESERKLCKSSNLKPSQYTSFKAVIIKVSDHKRLRKSTR